MQINYLITCTSRLVLCLRGSVGKTMLRYREGSMSLNSKGPSKYITAQCMQDTVTHN